MRHNLLTFCADRDLALEELKIYGRDPKDADPIFTKEVSAQRPLPLSSETLQLSQAQD